MVKKQNKSVWLNELCTWAVSTSVLGALLLATALIPMFKHLPAVVVSGVNSWSPPTPNKLRPMLSLQYSVTNFVHRSVSTHGLLVDELYRGVMALFCFAIYYNRTAFTRSWVRRSLAAFSIAGSAACLSDAASFLIFGGVVDWIGLGGGSALAPSDLCVLSAPPGIVLTIAVGGRPSSFIAELGTLRTRKW